MIKLTRPLTYTLKYLFCTHKNPYKILGLTPDATEEDIKKAFRQIAHKYHPDKNPDPMAREKFVASKQAYETLMDQDKRRQFDNEAKYSSRGSGFDKNPFDQFNNDIFKDKSRVYHDTYSTGSVRRKKGQDIKKQVKIKFEDAIRGTKIKLNFQRRGTCQTCNGNRCQPGTAPTRCLACGGSGSTIYRQSSIVMHLQCSRCSGIGLIIKNPCKSCNAKGVKIAKIQDQFQIPQGIEDGQTLNFNGKGDKSQNGPSGDLHLKVGVEKHPRFRRVGRDIQTTEWITISQAALGTTKEVQTIWNKNNLKIEEGTQDGTKIKLKGQGVRKAMDDGDHVCLIRIKIPTKLTQSQREIFVQLAKTQTKEDFEEQNESRFQKFKDYFK